MSIIGGINEILASVRKYLLNWLEDKIPNICPTWWEDCVIAYLNPNQLEIVYSNNASSLQDLDLSILLRITKKNWMAIGGYTYYTSSDYFTVKDMIGVRNAWSHCSNLPEKEEILKDLSTLYKFSVFLGADKAFLKEISDFKKSISDANVKNSEPVKEVTQPVTNSINHTTSAISVGCMVEIKADKNLRGMVAGVSQIGDKTIYNVFVNGDVKEFLEDQISAIRKQTNYIPKDRNDLYSRLTALQINLPSMNGLYSRNSSKIDFFPYQYKPVLKIIKSDKPRLLIADSVGVGKTIEAGLILQEMEARGTLNSVVIVCPKPLISERKWENEMHDRFDESFKPVNGDSLREIIETLQRDDGEWPGDYSRAIIPYSILKHEALEGSFDGKKRHIGFESLENPPHIDLLIIDEAHHVRNRDTAVYKTVKYLCEHADAVVMLTATPLQMGDNDLFTLLNLLNPEMVIDEKTFALMAEPNKNINATISILRAKNQQWKENARLELEKITTTEWGQNVIAKTPEYQAITAQLEKESLTDEDRISLIEQTEDLNTFSSMINRTRRRDIQKFCIRHPQTVNTQFTEYQQNLYDSLISFESTVLSILHNPESVNFMTCQMKRQAASCIFGLAPYIKDIVEKRIDQLFIDETDEEQNFFVNSREFDVIVEQSEKLLRLASALPEEDSKFEELYKVISEKQKEENNKIILFSSFRHTLKYLGGKLSQKGIRFAQIDGSVANDDRYSLTQRFKLNRENPDAFDVLLFTEVGSEGLDYQFCDMIINYDLPWNPMKIEQRIGRIDRHGQKSDIIRIVNMVSDGTIDAAIYNRCLWRIGIFQDNIGDCEEILGNVYKDIKNVMLNNKLTEAEKEEKLTQETDNDIKSVLSFKKLKEDEDQFFSFEIANAVMTKQLENSDNCWITPEYLQILVSKYLQSKLGDGNYIQGEREIKNLRLSSEARVKLFEEDFKNASFIKTEANNRWKWYLRGNKADKPITFSNDSAKEDQNAILLNAMHPLVRQAASLLALKEPMTALFQISEGDYKRGVYPFIIYSWTYKGIKEKTKIVASCTEPFLEKEVFEVIQTARLCNIEESLYEQSWKQLKEKYLEDFETARQKYKQDVQTTVLIKETSLKNYYWRLEESVNSNIRNNQNNSSYVKGQQAILARQNSERDKKLGDLQLQVVNADILQEPILYGVIEVV